MEANSPAPTPPVKPPLSRWWVIGLLIAWLVLIAPGAIIIGIGFGGYDGSSGAGDSASMFIAGITCLCLGAAFKIAFWIVVCVRSRQKKHYHRSLSTTGVYVAGAPPVTGQPLPQTQKPDPNICNSTSLSPPARGLHPAGTTELSSEQYVSELAPTPSSTVPLPTSTTAELAGHYNTPQPYTTFMPVIPTQAAELSGRVPTPMSPSPPNLPPLTQKGAAEKEAVAKFCGHCGTALEVGTRFVCAQCGARL